MSAPSRSLQNLNLDEMPVTRSNSRSTGDGRGREQAHSASHRMNPLARPAQSAAPRYPADSSRRVSRNIQEPSHQTRLPGDFVVVNVKRINTNIDFILVPATTTSAGQSPLTPSHSMTVRPSDEQACVTVLYDSARGDYRASCDFRNDRSEPVCFHIRWLIGRLYSALLQSGTMQQTTAENINQQIRQLYESMQDMTTDDLLQRVRGEDDDAGSHMLLPSVSREERESRRTILSDILSSFDEDKTPKEFLREVSPSSVTSASPRSLLVENNLPATIFRLAMGDDHIYTVLYTLVPGDIRARMYYETQLSRAQEVLQSSDPVPQSVRNLRRIVHDMYEDRAERRKQFSHDPHEAIDAILADILMRLVRMVVDERNIIYRDMGRAASQERQRNIYTNLINNPPHNTRNMERWMKDMFVLDRYQELWNRNQERSNYRWLAILDQWKSVKRSVERMSTSNHDPATLYYASKIEEIIQALNGQSDPSTSSGLYRMPQIDQPF